MENKIIKLKNTLCDLSIRYFETHCETDNSEQRRLKEEIFFLIDTIKTLEQA